MNKRSTKRERDSSEEHLSQAKRPALSSNSNKLNSSLKNKTISQEKKFLKGKEALDSESTNVTGEDEILTPVIFHDATENAIKYLREMKEYFLFGDSKDSDELTHSSSGASKENQPLNSEDIIATAFSMLGINVLGDFKSVETECFEKSATMNLFPEFGEEEAKFAGETHMYFED
jgi:hypothetical protein